jgi:hypothetical protein
MNTFDIVNDISYGKKDLMRNSDSPELALKTYSSFLTNRSLSYHYDSIAQANEMNMMHSMPVIMQHDYLLASVRPKRRFSKWVKPSTLDRYDVIQQYYQVSVTKAKDISKALSNEDIKELKSRLIEGGRQNT